MSDLRDTILLELEISRRIVHDGHEVVPRFTIFAPDGPHVVMVQLPDNLNERVIRLTVAQSFMVWKAASGFILANELLEPDAVSVIAVTRTEIIGALQRIQRAPISFAEPKWFGRENIDDEIVKLLPPKVVTATHDELAFIKQAFEVGNLTGITWRRA